MATPLSCLPLASLIAAALETWPQQPRCSGAMAAIVMTLTDERDTPCQHSQLRCAAGFANLWPVQQEVRSPGSELSPRALPSLSGHVLVSYPRDRPLDGSW